MALPINEGDVVAEKYVVERVIGRGGMGVVVSATNVKLDQRVALKFLLEEATQIPDVVQRFIREARSAAKIQCDHVARVMDVDTLPTGEPYIVMEYMEGEDLHAILERTRVLGVEDTVSFVLQACEALAEAHALGIVHRDLKPGNLFLARRPNGEPIVKVLDFGISKSTSAVEAVGALTRTASIMGSPFYMSPEQMTSAKHVDARSDVWSVGVVMYQFLAGRPPFTADGLPNLVLAIMHDTPAHLRVSRPDVPEGLDDAIRRCLEKDPAQRFQNVAELAAAIAPYGPPRASVSVERIAHVLGARLSAVPTDAAGAPMAPFRPPTRSTPGVEGAAQAEAMKRSQPDVTNPLWTKSLGDTEVPKVPKKGLRGAALALGLGASAIAALVAFRLHVASPEASAPQATAASESAPTATPPAPAAPPTAGVPSRREPEAPATQAASSAPVAPVTATSAQRTSVPAPAPSAPSAHVAAAPPARAQTRPSPARQSTAASDCDVPFTVDSAGHRIPKPECL